ncbi:peptidase [Gardnerella vaginalis]|uniref:peptidase n=1 Tax=Gardnerella vaginalis TaxID=2702 RepID=UPI000E2126E5|nr:peptidase [Gardnerella vaginalis]RDW96223.1 peptidase [Gardnerella vaginalis]RDW97888.1 peptidase [Gardnerella vaginalis]
MMNKKAIAAFAAGATLLAGFAMATPAMAFDFNVGLDKDGSWVSTQKKAATKAQVLRLEAAVEEAKATVEEKTKAANEAQTATYADDTDGTKKKAAVEKAQKELSEAQKSLEEAQKALNEAKPAPAEADPKNPQDTKPAETSKDAKAKPGQTGANGAAAVAKTTVVEKKKDGGKKLPATGVGVTLTALAATMLAGMGAAVRKARH